MRALMKLMLIPLCLTLIGCGGGGGGTKTGGTPSKAAGTPSTAGPALSPEEATMKGTVDLMVEVAVIVESIKDEKSADEAIGKLKKAKARSQELEAKMKDVPPEKMKTLGEKYMKDALTTGERIEKAKDQAIKNVPTKAKDIAAALDDKDAPK